MALSVITQSQWKSIGKVGLFIIGSTALALVTVILTQNKTALDFIAKYPELVTLGPVLNWLAVIIQKFLTNGEEQAIQSLPVALQPSTQKAVQEITATATSAVVDAVTQAQNTPNGTAN
jgi:hypothetical protein